MGGLVLKSAFAVAVTLAAAGAAHAQSLAPKAACASLTGFVIPAARIALPTGGATIQSAVLAPATGPEVPAANALPEHCVLRGVIASLDPKAPPINFQVAIPTRWNGKAWQVGGNGGNGFIPLMVNLPRDFQGSPVGGTLAPEANFPLARGYATYGGDSGHGGALPPGPGTAGVGNLVPDNSWTANPEAYRNFGYESIKKTHDAAMAVFMQMYGAKPRINYFGGESQGGREAIQALGRYAADYDGVTSSVPLVHFSSLIIARPLRTKAQFADGAWLPPSKNALIGKETLRLCDELDGLKDGVINNYLACNRMGDPAKNSFKAIRCPTGADEGDQCLSDKQIATLNLWHSPVEFGVKLKNGETGSPGFPVGSEEKGGWADQLRAKPDAAKPPAATAGYHLTLRYADKPGAGDLYTHSTTELATTLQDLSASIDQPNDWSAFLAKGGKLILYGAANDYLTNPNNQVRMYDQAVKRHGKGAIDRAVRFYMTPYAPHNSASQVAGGGDPLPRYVDLMGAMERWVEQGKTPPDALLQTYTDKTPPYAVKRARPLCRYPNYPRYRGSGDPKLMESYSCAAP